MTNPLTDPYFVLLKVYKEGTYLKQAIASTPVEPLNKARTVKICYGVMEKDVYLDGIIAYNAPRAPKLSVKILLKTALYMLEFMGKHDYMVIDCAVELAKKLGKQGAAGFVNAFLRGYRLPPPPKNADQRMALECSAPLWLVKKLRRSYKGEAAKILSTPSLGVCVRFVRGAEEYTGKPHISTPFDGVYIFKNFVRDQNFFKGDYTFQSVGSVAICNVIRPAQNFLDACSAPGGKAVLLAQKCQNVVAGEVHAHRVELIKEYAARMGADNITAIQADASEFNPKFYQKFDGVLVDAPCTGTGVINENPDIKFFRKEGDVAELCALQLKILNNCTAYVKPGGRLYYSTCSVLPEENDSVAHLFLEQNSDFTLDIPTSPLGHTVTKYGLRFLPHLSMGAGFFVTCFVKGGG